MLTIDLLTNLSISEQMQIEQAIAHLAVDRLPLTNGLGFPFPHQ